MDFSAYLRPYITSCLSETSRTLWVAYSGGVDSHVLLHALASLTPSLDFKLGAIHIHHGLSANADLWQRHCGKVCKELGLEFRTTKLHITQQRGESLEALAREQRYEALVSLAEDQSTIVLGQHQDDQLETVLLQLKRGAGPKGLSGMAASWSSVKDAKIINFCRPFLAISRADIMAYATQHNLQWQEDESNQNTDFERNFLRQDVLPRLTEKWPELAKSVSRSAALCAEQQALLDEVCEQKLSTVISPSNTLNIPLLLQFDERWRVQLVRLWLANQGIQSPSQAVLGQLSQELLLAKEDATPLIQWQKWQFRRYAQHLYVLKTPVDLYGTHMSFSVECELSLPLGLGRIAVVDSEKLNQEGQHCPIDLSLGEVGLRFGGYGASCKPAGEAYSKPLKQWLKLWNIAPWERDKVAIVEQNSSVIALVLKGKLIPMHRGNEPQKEAEHYLYFMDV